MSRKRKVARKAVAATPDGENKDNGGTSSGTSSGVATELNTEITPIGGVKCRCEHDLTNACRRHP
jgi:hypothetical protein